MQLEETKEHIALYGFINPDNARDVALSTLAYKLGNEIVDKTLTTLYNLIESASSKGEFCAWVGYDELQEIVGDIDSTTDDTLIALTDYIVAYLKRSGYKVESDAKLGEFGVSITIYW